MNSTIGLLEQALQVVKGRPSFNRDVLEKLILAALYTLEAEEATRKLEAERISEPPSREA